MQSTLAKSVFVGLAALSFASVAQLNANAATATKTVKGSNVTLTSATAESRNVNLTGSNAIYTYPKTVRKSAKTVASKAQVATLASSKSSKTSNFRVYRTLKTTTGSVYYKVVSFDGSVRGYIYGGKSYKGAAAVATDVAGGLKAANTTTAQTLTNDEASKTYYFANPGKKNVTWNMPQYTQYKTPKKVVSDTTDLAGDQLKITKAETKTLEGTRYVYVQDQTNPSMSGWIYAKALSTTKAKVYSDATDVKVNYIDVATNKTVKSGFVTADAASKKAATAVTINDALYNSIAAEAPTGYSYRSTDNNNKLTNVKTGDTVTAYVYATSTSKLAFYAAPETTTNVTPGATVPGSSLSGYTQLTAKNVTFPKLDSKLYTNLLVGRPAEQLKGTDVQAFANTNLKTLEGTTTVTKDNKAGHYVYTLDQSKTFGDVAFGSTYNLIYTTKWVANPAVATEQGDTAYVAN